MTTINSVAQSHALAAAHAPKPAQPQRGVSTRQGGQSAPAPGTDGDGDHGIEPGGGSTGKLVNIKG